MNSTFYDKTKFPTLSTVKRMCVMSHECTNFFKGPCETATFLQFQNLSGLTICFGNFFFRLGVTCDRDFEQLTQDFPKILFALYSCRPNQTKHMAIFSNFAP